MSVLLKKKFTNPDDARAVTAAEYYKELKEVLKKWDGNQTEFFFIPEFDFKLDPKNPSPDGLPLLWLGEATANWKKLLKPKERFASGLTAGLVDPTPGDDDDEDDGGTEPNAKVTAFIMQDGPGAKMAVAKKIEKFVKKVGRIRVKFTMPEEEQPQGTGTTAQQLVDSAVQVGSATSSPFRPLVQQFKSYQQAPSLGQKMELLTHLSDLLDQWEAYPGDLKADEQKNSVKQITDFIEKDGKARVEALLGQLQTGVDAFWQNGINRADLPTIKDAINRKATDVEKIKALAHSGLQLRDQIQNGIQVCQLLVDRKTISWFSDLKTYRKKFEEDFLVKVRTKNEHLKNVLKDLDPTSQVEAPGKLSAQDLQIATPQGASKKVTKALERYQKILTEVDNLDAHAAELQTASYLILTELKDNTEPWAEQLKEKIWEQKDKLGEVLYDNNNYNKILEQYELFNLLRDRIEETKTEPQQQQAVAKKMIEVIAEIGYQIGAWEDQANLNYNNFETKEKGRRVEVIRSNVTRYMLRDLNTLAANTPLAKDIQDLQKDAVFINFTDSKNYDGNLRKLLTDASTSIATIKQEVSVAVASGKPQKTKVWQKFLERYNANEDLLYSWSLQAQRCDLEKDQTTKDNYAQDQKTFALLKENLDKEQQKLRDLLNVLYAFETNKDTLATLDKEITALETSIQEVKDALATPLTAEVKDQKILQLAMLRSQLLQKELQSKAAANMLVQPFERLKELGVAYVNLIDPRTVTVITNLEDNTVQQPSTGQQQPSTDPKALKIDAKIKAAYQDRLDSYKTLLQDIFSDYQLFLQMTDARMKEASANQLLQRMTALEKALGVEDNYRKKLLDEYEGYANLMGLPVTEQFKVELDAFGSMRQQLNDVSKPANQALSNELYTKISDLYQKAMASSNAAELFQLQLDIDVLTARWEKLNHIVYKDSTGQAQNLDSGDYQTKHDDLAQKKTALANKFGQLARSRNITPERMNQILRPDFQKQIHDLQQLLVNALNYINPNFGAIKGAEQRKKELQEQLKAAQTANNQELVSRLQGEIQSADLMIQQSTQLESKGSTQSIESLRELGKTAAADALLKIHQSNQKAAKAIQGMYDRYMAILQDPVGLAAKGDPDALVQKAKQDIQKLVKKAVAANLQGVRDYEGKFFAALGDDYDYFRSKKDGGDVLSSSKSDQTQYIGKGVIDRFQLLEAAGASPEELRRSLEHLPVSVWPDECLETLHAWNVVNQRAIENAQERGQDLNEKNKANASALIEQNETLKTELGDAFSLIAQGKSREEVLGPVLDKLLIGFENADKVKDIFMALCMRENGIIQKYSNAPEKAAYILSAIKNSKAVVEALMGKEEEEDENAEPSFVKQTEQIVKLIKGEPLEEDKEEEEEDEDKPKSTAEKVSELFDDVIKGAENVLSKFNDSDADKIDKALATMSFMNDLVGGTAKFLDAKAVEQWSGLVGSVFEGIADTKDLLTNDKLSKREKFVKAISTIGSITGTLSGKDGLLEDTEVGKVLEIVTKVTETIKIVNESIERLIGKEKLSREEIEERLSQRPDALRSIKTDVLGPMQTVIDLVGDANKIAQLFGAAVDLAPGLSIASNVLSLIQQIIDIAKTLDERSQHKGQHQEALLYTDDDALALSLRQNVSNDNKRLASQVIDAFATGVSTAGAITTLAGGPAAAAGVALQYTGTAIKIGAKVIFTIANEVHVAEVRKLIEKAKDGDREAQMNIFRQSAFYAKMYIISLAQEAAQGNKRAEAMAKEFCLGYGITEKNLKDETAEMILRQIFKQTGESDDRHSQVVGMIESMFTFLKDTFTTDASKIEKVTQVLKTNIKDLSLYLDKVDSILGDSGIDDAIAEGKLKKVHSSFTQLRTALQQTYDQLTREQSLFTAPKNGSEQKHQAQVELNISVVGNFLEKLASHGV